MTPFYELLADDGIALTRNTIASPKKVLETLAGLCAHGDAKLETKILHKLAEREKLGSTSLGDGVAIPHCRTNGVSAPQLALLRVEPGIDHNAPDHLPVQLFIALVVPEQATDEHLQLLAQIATILNQEPARTALLKAETPQEARDLLKLYTP